MKQLTTTKKLCAYKQLLKFVEIENIVECDISSIGHSVHAVYMNGSVKYRENKIWFELVGNVLQSVNVPVLQKCRPLMGTSLISENSPVFTECIDVIERRFNPLHFSAKYKLLQKYLYEYQHQKCIILNTAAEIEGIYSFSRSMIKEYLSLQNLSRLFIPWLNSRCISASTAIELSKFSQEVQNLVYSKIKNDFAVSIGQKIDNKLVKLYLYSNDSYRLFGKDYIFIK